MDVWWQFQNHNGIWVFLDKRTSAILSRRLREFDARIDILREHRVEIHEHPMQLRMDKLVCAWCRESFPVRRLRNGIPLRLNESAE